MYDNDPSPILPLSLPDDRIPCKFLKLSTASRKYVIYAKNILAVLICTFYKYKRKQMAPMYRVSIKGGCINRVVTKGLKKAVVLEFLGSVLRSF